MFDLVKDYYSEQGGKEMKKLLVLLMICCMCTACGTKEETKVDVPEQAEEIVKEAAEEIVEPTVISPLPSTIDMTALDNCTLAVSFEEGDAYVDDTGKMQLKVTVYDYELFDMVDIANLKEGDTIVIQGNEVVVETMETLESGLLFINGGMEEGGYDLWHDESGVYFEHGFNDAKAYQPIGEATIRVSVDFEGTNESGEVIYYPGSFLTDYHGVVYDFTPYNTTIVVEDGQVLHMTHIFTP